MEGIHPLNQACEPLSPSEILRARTTLETALNPSSSEGTAAKLMSFAIKSRDWRKENGSIPNEVV
jgi:hypothetical protein